ncbi:hypothetical protein HZF24_09945 [Sedimentibacter hydroxybenzoicus DSM 7310]|uniref:Uncharacterized protein n=1 Tax=Sedimentibacter hydroxybenzoicus DSM 7310 TaxID=1123245 RepID=A0A974BKC4_SEDHY|nr:hypothetical protein [Sedimentibacter hydroxybenzoicus]NYB74456.1 hypothetical protein [Sedimentibacter hydroxybenzoicus DSM 7310]
MRCSNKNDVLGTGGIAERCCVGQSGCDWDGTLRNVVTEPIYVQKVYDAVLFNLQGLKTAPNTCFEPNLGCGVNIIRIADIRCRKFFNPDNINDDCNLRINPDTTISGGQFVKKEDGCDYKVVGPDGTLSEKLIWVDTELCDDEDRGTPVFGTQNVEVSGCIEIEMDLVVTPCNSDNESIITLSAMVEIADKCNPLILTNFFEICVPSVFDTAFLPRFTEFCNLDCVVRLATNSIQRDFTLDPRTGELSVNLIISLCISCEKKIVVPVQLCVLSTGFTEISPEQTSLCQTFPRLFPRQIDENSVGGAGGGSGCRPRAQSMED